jgi:hypothetical protein
MEDLELMRGDGLGFERERRRCKERRAHNMGVGACSSKKPPKVQELKKCDWMSHGEDGPAIKCL